MRKIELLVLMIVIVLATGCSKTTSAIEDKLKMETDTKIGTYSNEVIPALESLPAYENIEYSHKHKSMLVFECDAIALVVEYDEDTYLEEKQRILDEIYFLDAPVISEHDETKYYIPENEFALDTYDFKVIGKGTNDNTEYPKYFGMIGLSEDKISVAYLYYYDQDLDYINAEGENPMLNFVTDNFDIKF